MIGDRESFARIFSVSSFDILLRRKMIMTTILDAALEGNEQKIRELIERGANVNCVDVWGQNVLHALAKRGATKSMFVLLVSHGADVNMRAERNWTPLHEAADQAEKRVAKLLIDHGADVNATDTILCTPLYLAVRSGCLELIKLLINSGCDVNQAGLRG